MKTSYAYSNEAICNLTVRKGWSEGEIETWTKAEWGGMSCRKLWSSTGCTGLTACIVIGMPKSVSMTVLGISSNHRLVSTSNFSTAVSVEEIDVLLKNVRSRTDNCVSAEVVLITIAVFVERSTTALAVKSIVHQELSTIALKSFQLSMFVFSAWHSCIIYPWVFRLSSI